MGDQEELPLSSGAARTAHEGLDLGPRAMAAGQWRLASSALQVVLQLGVGVVLARLLPPADFGQIALATVVIGFASVVGDLGLGSSVIQRELLTPRLMRAAFTISVMWGSALAAVLLATAPLWARALSSPPLAAVLRAEALLFVFAGLGSTALAVLRRSLRFRQLFILETSSYVVGYALVATGMAFAGFGIWSLVCGALVQRLVASVLALGWVRHPMWPLLARNESRALMGFGIGASLTQLVNYVARNGDNAIVGRWLGTTMLGLYSRAFNLMALPLGYLDNVMWSVLYPVLAQLRSDRARFKRAYILSLQLTSVVAGPSMAALFVTAPHLITTLYGERWAGAVAPLQVLCCIGPLRSVYNVAGTVAHASGRVYAELARQIGYALLVLVGSLAGLRFGVTGVAWGVAVAVACMYLAMGHLSVRASDCDWRCFVRAQVPGWILGITVAACGLAVRVALEDRGVPRLWILIGTLLGCAIGLPVGLLLLPAGARPAELFARLGHSARLLPRILRDRVLWALRVPS
jgi:O-antigen/teichoic acid export membrane protein